MADAAEPNGEKFFPTIGDTVDATAGEGAEEYDNGITSIPNTLCMDCGETGTTNMIMTR